MTNTASAPKKKKRLSMHQKQSLAGWAFLMPATLLIFIMSFYPMFSALLTSFKRGKPTALVWSEPLWRNYQFMLKDKVFIQSVTNTLTYLIIQVPIMLILAVIFASLLNNRDLKFRGLFRTCIFLPCRSCPAGRDGRRCKVRWCRLRTTAPTRCPSLPNCPHSLPRRLPQPAGRSGLPWTA